MTARKIRFEKPPEAESGIKWSNYQEEIFSAVAPSGAPDIIVTARAGSAKTTTAIEALVFVPAHESVMLAAFNKGIERQLAKLAPEGVEVRTLHSYGFRTLGKALGSINVDSNRTGAICQTLYGENLTREVATGLVHAVSACKNLMAETSAEIEDAIYRMNVDTGIQFPKGKIAKTPTHNIIEWQQEQHELFVRRVGELLDESKDVRDVIDFDDMIWLPNVLDLKTFEYDRIFLDEAQDINPTQLALVERGLGGSGQLVSIGDDRQAIYGWRGADLTAMQSEGATHMKLPICYRCGKSIVRLAKKLVPDIEAWSQAREGEVLRRVPETVVDMAEPGDFILSRTNAPLSALWLRLVAAGKSARILGRSVGSGIGSFVRRSRASSVVELMSYTERWLQIEIAKLSKLKRSTEAAHDQAKCIEHISHGLSTVEEVLRRIEDMFTQNVKSERVMLSTVHKAKGLESNRVFVLMETFCWRPQVEEQNIFYVAVTRAKNTLVLVGNESDVERCVLGRPSR